MRAAVVDGELVAGDVAVDDGVVVSVGEPVGSGATDVAVPGFIDLQVNGFAGVDFLTADVDGYRRARDALAATGVTSFQPTLVTSPVDAMVEALRVAAGAAAGLGVLGVHLEGPFISPEFVGAHNPDWVLPPDIPTAGRLLAAGPVTFVTLAPEVRGGMDLLRWLVARGVVVSLGHTNADAAEAHAAFDAGARAITHLFNAQRRFTARDPGVSAVALNRPDVVVGLIADFVHVAPESVLLAWRAAPGRVALVTDAVASPDRARLGDGTLAGSVVPMDQAVRNVVGLGVRLVDAVAAVTTVPAALLGRADLGTLRPGSRADVVVLDDSLEVVRTLIGGNLSHG